MFKFVALLALVLAADAARVNFRPCPGNLPTPNWVESDYCTGDTCTLTRGQTFTARISFTPREQFSALMVGIQATFLGLPFPIAIPQGYENACDFLEAGARCPVQANANYIWALQAPIDASYPAANGLNMEGKRMKIEFK
jgi:hypothetical protein